MMKERKNQNSSNRKYNNNVSQTNLKKKTNSIKKTSSNNNFSDETILKKIENKKRKQQRERRKKQIILVSFSLFLIIVLAFFFFLFKNKKIQTASSIEKNDTIENMKKNTENINSTPNQSKTTNTPREITDWRLTLANVDNILPEDFSVELANIDKNRQFDKRAIGDLNHMMVAARNAGISDFWIQSSYRSIAKQKELFENSIQKHIKAGKTVEEAEKQTLLFINKPGGSDHNLGLAVDFNYVNDSFQKTKIYSWLKQNAEEYGFILRYPKEKESITKISYEPWHWRYVGQEHAKKMNKLNLCLEEYIEYLKNESL